MKLTLDWNCVIEVEEQRHQASCVVDLVKAHRSGERKVNELIPESCFNLQFLQPFPRASPAAIPCHICTLPCARNHAA